MRISYWSSDVCSSDLTAARLRPSTATMRATRRRSRETGARDDRRRSPAYDQDRPSCGLKIGRASCRERVCQYVSISVVAVSLNKKQQIALVVHRPLEV